MIVMKCYRRQANDTSVTEKEMRVSQALDRLVCMEVAYGGRFITINRTCVSIRTTILSTVDITSFVGSEEEMRPLIDFCYTCLLLQKSKALDHIAGEISHLLTEIVGANTLILTSLGPFLVGETLARLALLNLFLAFHPALDTKAPDFKQKLLDFQRKLDDIHLPELVSSYHLLAEKDISWEGFIESLPYLRTRLQVEDEQKQARRAYMWTRG